MKTVFDSFEHEIVIQKSRFIGILKPLKDKGDLKEILASISKKYPKATHYCYAYVCQGMQKSNDDGEPSGTAGRPILETLLKWGLSSCLLVVVRYFGGIKLGAGGLLRAYIDASCAVLNDASFYIDEERYLYRIKVDYDKNEVLKIFFVQNSIETLNILYEEKVIYEIACIRKLEIELRDYMQGKVEIEFLNTNSIFVPLKK